MTTFLTEVNVKEQFAPPASSGVRIKVPQYGQKELVFPDVKPRTFQPSNNPVMFGYPKWGSGFGTGKKASEFSFRHLRSRNLLSHNTLGDQEQEEEEEMQMLLNNERLKASLPAPKRTAIDVASSVSGDSGVTSMTGTTAVTAASSGLAALRKPPSVVSSVSSNGARPPQRVPKPPQSVVSSCGPRSPVPSMVAGSSVSPSAYEGLVSVSQLGGAASERSGRSGRSSQTANSSQVARLQNELESERDRREATEKRLLALQERQDRLLERLQSSNAATLESMEVGCA